MATAPVRMPASAHSTGIVPLDHLAELERRASLGAMTGAMIHDLASIVQGVQCALDEIQFLAESSPEASAQMLQAVAIGSEMSNRMIETFRATSAFLRTRDVTGSPCPADLLVERACAVTHAYTRQRATVRVGAIADVAIAMSEASILQVLVNVLRNAADASPPNGVIDIEVVEETDHVTFRITDDGPGVPPDLAAHMFDRHPHAGFGLSISASVMATHRGSLRYRRADGRGAQFEVTVPKPSNA